MKIVKVLIALAALAILCLPIAAQPYGLSPEFYQQYFGVNGQPLSGGFIYTCMSGTACGPAGMPSPQPTYTSSSGATANTNPVQLTASGTGQIWLNCALSYTLTLTDVNMVVIQTTNNVTCANGGGGGGGSNGYWVLNGTTISNTNGGPPTGCGGLGCPGNVTVGADFSAADDILIGGRLMLQDASTDYAIIRAAAITTTTTWRWPGADVAGCMVSDGMGNLSFSPSCSGSGGTPGGTNTDVQFNNSGVFGGSANLTWQNAAQLLTVKAASSGAPGLVNLTGYVQSENGFLAANVATPTKPLNYNVVQAPFGGMYALSFTALDYIQSGNSSGVPPLTTADMYHAGALYCDTTSSPCTEKLYNGVAWVSLATGGATSPGGSNTDVQFNSAGSFGGSNNFTWGGQKLLVTGASSSTPGMQVLVGYMQADAGFLASIGTATSYNSIQAPGGGMYGLSFTALNYVQTGTYSGPVFSGPPLTTNDTFHVGAMSYSTASGCETVFSGTIWSCIGGIGPSPTIHVIGASFDGAGSALTSGSTKTNYFTVPFACTIQAWNITVDTGTISFDVWKVATGTAIPTGGNTILTGGYLNLSSGTALHSTSLANFATTSVATNDIFGINIRAVSSATKASLVMQCQ